MFNLKGCKILLDSPTNTYYAGQTINGQVKLTFDSPKKVRGILIRFLGEANTLWECNDDNFYGHEEYFKHKHYLMGGENSPEIEIPSGELTYPFSFALSPTLPSSFEHRFGHVRYTIKVTLNRPWKFDQDLKMAYTVIAPVDLNLNPRVKEPFVLDLEKSFCCKSGALAVVTSIPVTGYVSGQIIPIRCEFHNASNVRIKKVKFELRKRVTFHSNPPHAQKFETMTTIDELICPVGRNESKLFTKNYKIPTDPLINLVNCSIIALDYHLHIKFKFSGPHCGLTGNIPITFGTRPLAYSNLLGPGSNGQAGSMG